MELENLNYVEEIYDSGQKTTVTTKMVDDEGKVYFRWVFTYPNETGFSKFRRNTLKRNTTF